jgi:NTP pyrophosphatase (non-canonical NTP hydrolase)
MMDFDNYQHRASATKVYPGQGEFSGLAYVGLGCAGEAGEVANQIKKAWRNNNGEVTSEQKAKILDECGDVLCYVSQICNELDERMSTVAQMNLLKLKNRKSNGELKVHS